MGRSSFLFKYKNLSLLLFFICLGGGISLLFGQDMCFDFQNYHLYIPYAFLHGRAAVDIIPAGAIHTFFNPLLDIPSYLLFTALTDWPHLVGFLMGGFYGVFLFAVWKSTSLLFPREKPIEKWLHFFVFCLAVTGIAALLQIGRFTNEIQTALLGVTAGWLLLKFVSNYKTGFLCLSSFVAAFAAGLKYTAAPVAVGIGLGGVFLLFCRRESWRKYVLFGLSGLGGFLLADGWFLYQKWTELGNPFFPYFNHIFKSPYFTAEALPNGSLTPAGWKGILFLPFLRYNILAIEYRLDIRLILGLVSCWVLWAKFLFGKERLSNIRETIVLCFFSGTYIAWVWLFGNMRYTVCLEVFSAWLFALALKRFLPIRITVCIVASVWAALLLRPLPEWPREPFMEKTIVFSQEVSVPDNAFVLLAGHLSFLIPFLNPNARYAGGVWFDPEKLPSAPEQEIQAFNWLQRADYRHHFAPIIQREIARHEGPVYILAPSTRWAWKDALWSDYGIKVVPSTESCQFFFISPDMLYDGFMLCEAQKTS